MTTHVLDSTDPLPDWVAQLRLSIKESSERGLIISTKWATEMLNSIPTERRRTPGGLGDLSMQSEPRSGTEISDPEEQEEEDFFAYARQVFDAKEFQRVATILRDCDSPKAVFLRLYAKYLESERVAQLQWWKLSTSREQPPAPINNALLDLLELVNNSNDPWVLFLQGIVYNRLSRRQDCVRAVLASVATRPWNWSAWELLASAIETYAELEQVLASLPFEPKHPVVTCFRVKVANDFYNSGPSDFSAICALRRDYFCSKLADAEKQFDANLAAKPYRLDDMDAHASVLWLSEKKARISELACHFSAAPQDKPEYYCLMGNHYSARKEHEKAVRAFRKATYLDRTYGAAWTLMGHEYYDLGNYHAAIESYRRAIDVNAKDYRAWSGLGRSYSQLKLHTYAIYYNRRSTEIKPSDARSWMALAESFEDVNKYRDAIACCRRAIDLEQSREIAIKYRYRLGWFYRRAGEHPQAAETYLEIFKLCREEMKLIRMKENVQSVIAFADIQTTHENSFGNILDAYLLLKNVPAPEDVVLPRAANNTPAAAADALKKQREAQLLIKEYMKDNIKEYSRVREILARIEATVYRMTIERRQELRRRSLVLAIPGVKLQL
ncbi:hypothetical protein HDZ31DRAFT_33935 [Schizophyllum fasciatum]